MQLVSRAGPTSAQGLLPSHTNVFMPLARRVMKSGTKCGDLRCLKSRTLFVEAVLASGAKWRICYEHVLQASCRCRLDGRRFTSGHDGQCGADRRAVVTAECGDVLRGSRAVAPRLARARLGA